jgi:ABC-type multidrug transport system fused ATPase/permease subunit
LNRAQRVDSVFLLGLMFVGMVLEMLGVGLVLPALALMTRSGGGGTTANALRGLIPVAGVEGREQLVITGMLALVAVYTVKSAFLAFLAWRQMRFVFGAQSELSYRLFVTYLRQPYSFHLQRNSALLIRNVINEIPMLCQAMFVPMLYMITEGLVLLGVAAVLICVEPRGALIVAGVTGAIGLVFHLATRGAVLRWGAARLQHEGGRIVHLQQGLGGIKDVLVLGREREFSKQFSVDNVGAAMASQKRETLHQMPRVGLELLAVIGLAVLVIVKVRSGNAIDTILPTIGLFAAAAFRIIPSVNRVFNCMHNIKYALPVLTMLHKELSLTAKPVVESLQELPFHKSIRVAGISYTYPGAITPALELVSLTVRRGTTVGFIGGSGAGKSTLVDILLGLQPPDCGRILVDDYDIAGNIKGWQRNIGYVPQSIFLTDDSLRRNIAFGISPDQVDEAAVWRAVTAAQLAEYVRGLPEGLDSIVGERGVRLSGGQLQRIGIARALYHDPPILILDEATSSLDTATERGVMEAVGALHGRKTIFIVAHRLTTLRDCDWIYRIESGQLVGEGDVATMIGPIGRVEPPQVVEERR